MTAYSTVHDQQLNQLLTSQLQPEVNRIDQEGWYPEHVLRKLGEIGSYKISDKEPGQVAAATLNLLENVSAICASTAFSIWCQLAAILYVHHSDNQTLKQELLQGFENGSCLAGTGLSNPLKFYADLEPLKLQAERVDDGYRIKGTLPFVSNVGSNHWFGIIAKVDTGQHVMALVPCEAEGLSLSPRHEFMGLNGTATYTCQFDHVHIPDRLVLAERAEQLVQKIRPFFIINQIGLALGIGKASIDYSQRIKEAQPANSYLPIQPESLREKWLLLRKKAYNVAQKAGDPQAWKEILSVRLQAAYLVLETTQAELLHRGGAGYLQRSPTSRRIREAAFIAVLTPTIKHLEKLLAATAAHHGTPSRSLI